MAETKTFDISTEVFAIIFFAILALTALSIAKRKGVFTLTKGESTLNLSLKTVLLSFFLYLLINSLITGYAYQILKSLFFNKSVPSNNVALVSITNLISNLLVTASLSIICFTNLKGQIRDIWKDKKAAPHSTYSDDIKVGAIYWLIAFPVVMLFSNFFEFILKFFLSLKELPEQVIINFVKMTQENIQYYIFTLLSIVIFAPLIEEFLFRGLLQNYLKRFGIKNGIILTSIFFALFHFSPAQGFSNITIIFSLFILSIFLGNIYEKQRSLISPIVLHATFNAISAVNLLLFKGQ